MRVTGDAVEQDQRRLVATGVLDVQAQAVDRDETTGGRCTGRPEGLHYQCQKGRDKYQPSHGAHYV